MVMIAGLCSVCWYSVLHGLRWVRVFEFCCLWCGSFGLCVVSIAMSLCTGVLQCLSIVCGSSAVVCDCRGMMCVFW